MLRALALAALIAGCGTRPPHRFSSPMLGMASVPPPPLPRGGHDVRDTRAERGLANREVRAQPIRVTSAPRIREASAAAATAVVATSPVGSADERARLPAPHRETLTSASASAAPALRSTSDLRALVGRRDTRPPIEVALGWARELGMQLDVANDVSGPDLVAWAEGAGRLHDATTPPERGDLLVFDRVNSDDEADLVAVVIARDERGVTELAYVGNGIVRRGFVDASRPTVKRDKQRAIVNTFMRHGKRWPAKGSHYLAGEHLAHVIR